MLEEKVNHAELDELKYEKLQTQPYLSERRFSTEEGNLLLRSRCFSAKSNFKKSWRGHLNCSLGCPSNDDPHHIFTQCIWLNSPAETQYENIFLDTDEQKEAVLVFKKKESIRKHLFDNLYN